MKCFEIHLDREYFRENRVSLPVTKGNCKTCVQTRFEVAASYLEIYQDQVRDLVGGDSRAALHLSEDPVRGASVKDLASYVMRSAEDLPLMAAVGGRRRVVAITLMNQRSSRSHAVMQGRAQRNESGSTKADMLSLVDLEPARRCLLESSMMDQSLREVIGAPVDSDERVLGDSLGGGAASVVTHVSPSAADTLWCADRARRVRNVGVGVDHYLAEVSPLRSDLQQLVEPARRSELQDSLDEADTESASMEDSLVSGQEEELRQLEEEKERQQRELDETMLEQESLRGKLRRLELNFMVNGENLLEKCKRQDRLLQDYAREMEATENAQRHMQAQLTLLEVEVANFEDHCCSLEEDSESKTQKINKVTSMMKRLKDQLDDLVRRKRREVRRKRYHVEKMLDQVNWCDLVLASYVPECYMDLIDRHMEWNEQTEMWTVRHDDICGKLPNCRSEPRLQCRPPPTDAKFASHGVTTRRPASPLRLPRLRDHTR